MKRPRIDAEGAVPLIEFVNKNTKERPLDWFPDAEFDEVAQARRKEDERKRRNPPKQERHPLGYKLK